MQSKRIQIIFSRANVTPLLLLISLPFVGTPGCAKQTEMDAEVARSSTPSTKIQKVSVATAIREEVTDFSEFVGRTQANELVDIRSRVSGFLRKEHFEDGQYVKKGDPLYQIEPDQYEAIHSQSLAQVKIAEAQVDLAEKTTARSAKLLQQNAASRQQHEQNQAEVATAKAQLLAAQADAARTQLDVDYSKIVSPLNGRVDAGMIDEGNYVTGGILGGTILTTVISIDPMKAVANVDENEILRFMRRKRELAGDDFKEVNRAADLNIPCYMQLPDEDGFPHEGVVEYVKVRVDQATGTSTMRATFANAHELLKPGMFVRLRVPRSDPYTAVLVPDRAIGTDQATRFVYVVDGDNTVGQRQVELGDRKGNMRVIKSGVSPGEMVVTAGLQLIQPGMKVDPQPQEVETTEILHGKKDVSGNQEATESPEGGQHN